MKGMINSFSGPANSASSDVNKQARVETNDEQEEVTTSTYSSSSDVGYSKQRISR